MTDGAQHANMKHENGDELPTFSPFQTFIVENLDKSTSPDDLKKFLCPDVSRQSYLTVEMPCDKLRNVRGLAIVTAPKTYTHQMMEFDGTSSKSQRKKTLIIRKENNAVDILKQSKWIKNEEGAIYSPAHRASSYRVMPQREINMQYCLIDSGAYLFHEKFTSQKDIDNVIERAVFSGVEKIVIKCVNVRQGWKAQKLASRYPGILYFTAGVSTSQIKTWKEETTLSHLRELLANPQCVAVGEIGLDADISTDTQFQIFKEQVSLASEFGKPIIVNENRMSKEIMAVFDTVGKTTSLPPVCIDTSSQRKYYIEMYYEKGFYLSITGYDWKKESSSWASSWVGTILEDINNSRIMLASSSPHFYPYVVESFLSSSRREYLRAVYKFSVSKLTESCSKVTSKYCFSRNEPLCLQSVAELVSGTAKTSPEILAAITRKNSYKFFSFRESDERPSENFQQEMTERKKETEAHKQTISSNLLFCLAGMILLVFVSLQVINRISEIL